MDVKVLHILNSTIVIANLVFDGLPHSVPLEMSNSFGPLIHLLQ